jgi:hypothetical protein
MKFACVITYICFTHAALQCNHRSWADLMVDQYVTEGRSMFMSRLAVIWVFPLFMSGLVAMRSVVLFKRGSIANKDKFNRWIDGLLEKSPQSALAVYPEGHRNTYGESLPLKRGMLHYAFSRKMPVQIVIGANKEAILSEKHQTAHLGQTVAFGYSEVVRPENYDNFEDFMTQVQASWDAEWNTVFGADWEGLPEFQEPAPQWDYPIYIRLSMLGVVVLNLIVSAAALRWTILLLRAVLVRLGPLQWPVVLISVLYLAASFYVYSEPVDALTVHARMLSQRKRHPKLVQARNGDNYSGNVADTSDIDKKET